MIKITIIGETCSDIFIYCNSNRLSPEAPVPVLNPIHTTTNKGMSGNVVSNIEVLSQNLIDISHFHQKETITKTRYVDDKSNHMFVRIDSGEDKITPFDFNPYIKNNIETSDIVVVSDYNKGFIPDDLLVEIGKLSKLSILDSKRKLTKDILQSYTFIKLNENEANENNHLVDSNKLLITLGSKGCKHNNQIYPSPKPQETIDVSGAGDTFTSAFIIKYYETKDIGESINFANEMASIVVSRRGVTTIF